MDPLSISASAAGLITICLQTIKILKQTIETLKHAKQFLIDLLSQTERVRLFLEQLRGLAVRAIGADGEGIGKLVVAFDEEGVKRTLREMREWVDEMVGGGGVGMAVRVLMGKGKGEGLLGRLRRHEEEILGVVLWICATSSVRSKEDVEKSIDEALSRTRLTSAFSTKSDSPTVVEDDISGIQGDDQSSQMQPKSESEDKSTTAKFAEAISEVSTKKSDTDLDNELPAYSATEHKVIDPPAVVPSAPVPAPTQLDSQIPSEIASLVDAMKNLTPPNTGSDAPTTTSNLKSELVIDSQIPIWHGDLSRFDLDADYLHLRDRLSNAAYYGQMRDVIDSLAMGEAEYGERWANAPKLSYDPLRASGWTPLHQAVYMGSSIHEIRRLIEEFGALRLSRTILAGDLPHASMTALEIAQYLGAAHLEPVLAPLIYHAVPNHVMSRLQERFHGLVREDLGRHATKGLRLPELDVLGELRMPLMWFPLRKRRGEGALRGYLYRLDGRELLVKSFGVSENGEPVMYRITTDQTREIETAVIFDN
ncbi:hypothetical protein ACMFMG_002729 [Clarireedia jacksonii]